MDEANAIRVPITCECGHKAEIPIAGRDLDSLEWSCVGCGKVDRFTGNQILAIKAQVETARTVARDHAVGEINDMLKRVTRGSKVLKLGKNRPK